MGLNGVVLGGAEGANFVVIQKLSGYLRSHAKLISNEGLTHRIHILRSIQVDFLYEFIVGDVDFSDSTLHLPL